MADNEEGYTSEAIKPLESLPENGAEERLSMMERIAAANEEARGQVKAAQEVDPEPEMRLRDERGRFVSQKGQEGDDVEAEDASEEAQEPAGELDAPDEEAWEPEEDIEPVREAQEPVGPTIEEQMRQMADQVAFLQQQLAQRQAPQNVRPPEPTPVITEEMWDKAFIDNDPAARKAITDAANRAFQPDYSQEQIYQTAVQAARQELAYTRAAAAEMQFRSDETYGEINSHILDNPQLREIANQTSERLANQGYTDPTENIRLALEETRKLFPQPATQVRDEMQIRREAKARHSASSRPVGAQAPASPQPSQTSGAEDAISEIMRARGLRR